jgi:hypothetical protein
MADKFTKAGTRLKSDDRIERKMRTAFRKIETNVRVMKSGRRGFAPGDSGVWLEMPSSRSEAVVFTISLAIGGYLTSYRSGLLGKGGICR